MRTLGSLSAFFQWNCFAWSFLFEDFVILRADLQDSGEVKTNTFKAVFEKKHSEGFSFVINVVRRNHGNRNQTKLILKSNLRYRILKYFLVIYFMLFIAFFLTALSYAMKLYNVSTNGIEFYIHGSVHRNSILIRSNEMQHYAVLHLLQNHSTCFGCPSHPS